MPDVCQDQPIFCLEEIVVFVVSGDIYIGSLSYCGRSEEGTGTAADGYFPDLRFTDCSVTDDFTTESLFYLLQERQTIGWLGEFADDSETRYRKDRNRIPVLHKDVPSVKSLCFWRGGIQGP